MLAPLPLDEAERLQVLRNYEILDTPPEQAFERLTKLAAQIFNVPIAFVSLADMDFVSDTLGCARRFRSLKIVDCRSRGCLALAVDASLTDECVVHVLERLKEKQGIQPTPTV